MNLPIEQSAGLVLLSTAFANNLVLEWQLALCPFFATTRRVDVAVGMALVSVVVMTLMVVLGFSVYHFVLVPLDLSYLSLLIMVFMSVVLMQSTQWYIQSRSPTLYKKYAVFIPLLTLNCAVLSVILLALETVQSLATALIFGLGTSIGFGLVLVIFAGLSDRLDQANVPAAFKGIPISLISLGILSIAFSGF